MKKIIFILAILYCYAKVAATSTQRFRHLRNPFQYQLNSNNKIKFPHTRLAQLNYLGYMRVNNKRYALLAAQDSYLWVEKQNVVALQQAVIKEFDQYKMILVEKIENKKRFVVLKIKLGLS